MGARLCGVGLANGSIESDVMGNVPFVFGVGFFFRIFIPGIVATALIYLLADSPLELARLDQITIFLLASGLTGLIMRALFPFMNDFLWGTYWPGLLRDLKVKQLTRNLQHAEAIVSRPPDRLSEREKLRVPRLSNFIFNFPLSVNYERFVAAPTIVANMWASLVAHLRALYAREFPATMAIDRHMLWVFARIWWHFPHEVRRDLSDAVAVTEAILTTMIVSCAGSFAFLVKAARETYDEHTWWALWPSVGTALALAFVSWFLYSLLTRETLSTVITLQAVSGTISDAGVQQIIGEAKKIAVAQSKSEGQVGEAPPNP